MLKSLCSFVCYDQYLALVWAEWLLRSKNKCHGANDYESNQPELGRAHDKLCSIQDKPGRRGFVAGYLPVEGSF